MVLSALRVVNVALMASVLFLLPTASVAQFQDTHGAKKMFAALTAEQTQMRRESNLLRSALNPEVMDLFNAARDKERAEYEERGSLFYKDGTTIPGNENVAVRPTDPRVPAGLDDPFWAKIHAVENGEVSTSHFEDEMLEASTDAIETVDNGWTYVFGWGDTLAQGGARESEMVALLNASPNKIVRRTCQFCDATHAEVYYKRITAVPSDIMEIFKSDWRSASNTLGTDFDLYSTYEDAVSGVNAWTYCEYNSATVDMGFPGNCGPDGKVEDNWNLFQPRGGQVDVAFFVEDATVPAEDRQLSDIEVTREAKLWSDRDKTLIEGGCYGLYKLDERRACYRACEYMRMFPGDGTGLLVTANLGSAKLCRSLMVKGAGEGGTLLAISREFDGDGAEKGGKIKPTHMLGNDNGLPNMGTY